MRILIFIFFFSVATSAKEAKLEFKKKHIQINNITLEVELANTLEKQKQGLMYRKEKLGEKKGMLFVYSTEQPLTFWMKNTFIPLSIGFFDREKTLINIEDMQPVVSIMQNNVDIKKSAKPAMYALEVDQGWFLRNKVKPGHKFNFLKSEKRP